MKTSLLQEVLHWGKRDPERLCFIDGERRSTYGELRERVEAIALALAALVEQGDRVAILMESSFGYAAAWYGVWRAGAVAVGLNAGLKVGSLLPLLRHSQAGALVVDPRHPEAEALAASLPPGVEALFVGADGVPVEPPLQGEGAPVPAPEPGDLAAIVYTSGTTGHPKGVMLSHGAYRANTDSICAFLDIRPSDRALCVLPFYYSYGASVLHSHLARGAALIVERSLAFPHRVLDRIGALGATSLAGVPSTYYLLLRRTKLAEYDLSSLRYCTQAGGKMDWERLEEFRSLVPGAAFVVMYGQTEATARLAWLPPERLEEKRGSAGRAIPGVELVVKDEAGGDLLPGRAGEVCARGANVMLGYWRDPVETGKVLRDGWLHTGDIGHLDEEGYLFLQGRSREMIKSGAHRIAPGEIEEVVRGVEGVLDVAVVGVPDDLLGEAIEAHVLGDGEPEALRRRILAACQERLPLFKIPRAIRFRSSFPRTPLGKIRKHLLEGSGEREDDP